MPLDSLPGTLLVPFRDDMRELYLRSFRVRNPLALTTENTFPFIDASCQADVLQVVLRDAVVVNNGVTVFTCTGTAVDQRLAELGLTRLPAIGASGFVTISASAGGTTIFVGDEIKDEATGLRYQCTATATYLNGQPVPIQGVDVGEQTNQDGGHQLKWTTPRPGCGSIAIVVTQADGFSGLTGGHGIESDDDAKNRIVQTRANPPASGNDAQYQSAIAATPGIAVQQGFTYPCIKGNGSTGFVFTLRASAPGANRIPNGAQISSVLAYITGLFPAEDSIYAGTITAQQTDVALKITWAQGSPTWTDTLPWPEYFSSTTKAIIVQSATDSTHFVLATFNSSYVSVNQPTAGQTIGFYDTQGQKFRRKKILTVTGTGPWTIVCDTSNAASDTGYTPVAGQRACPWSESINNIPAALVAYFDSLGPGEQVASFFDAGTRQRRSPVSPSFFPNQISNRLTVPLLNLSSVQDVTLVEPTAPFDTTVGTPGVLSYLQVLRYAAVFPQVI